MSDHQEQLIQRQYKDLTDMSDCNKDLKVINEEHRKLNGELRKELDDAWDCINKMRAAYIELDEAYNMFLNTETQLRFNITHREEDN